MRDEPMPLSCMTATVCGLHTELDKRTIARSGHPFKEARSGADADRKQKSLAKRQSKAI